MHSDTRNYIKNSKFGCHKDATQQKNRLFMRFFDIKGD